MADFREKPLSFDRLKKKVHIAHDVKINVSLLHLIPFSLYVPRKNSFKQRTNFEPNKKKVLHGIHVEGLNVIIKRTSRLEELTLR